MGIYFHKATHIYSEVPLYSMRLTPRKTCAAVVLKLPQPQSPGLCPLMGWGGGKAVMRSTGSCRFGRAQGFAATYQSLQQSFRGGGSPYASLLRSPHAAETLKIAIATTSGFAPCIPKRLLKALVSGSKPLHSSKAA